MASHPSAQNDSNATMFDPSISPSANQQEILARRLVPLVRCPSAAVAAAAAAAVTAEPVKHTLAPHARPPRSRSRLLLEAPQPQQPDCWGKVLNWHNTQPEPWRMFESWSAGLDPYEKGAGAEKMKEVYSSSSYPSSSHPNPATAPATMLLQPQFSALSLEENHPPAQGRLLDLPDIHLGESLAGRDLVAEEMCALATTGKQMARAERVRRWSWVCDQLIGSSVRGAVDGETDLGVIWCERPPKAQRKWRRAKLAKVRKVNGFVEDESSDESEKLHEHHGFDYDAEVDTDMEGPQDEN